MTIKHEHTATDGGYGLAVERSYHPNHVTVSVPGTGLEWTMTPAEFSELVSHALDHEELRMLAGLA